MTNISNTKLTRIGRRLDRLIGKKEYPNLDRDYKKAAKLFFNLNNMGYELTSDDLRKALKLARAKFSKKMVDEMACIADAIRYLKLGIDDKFSNDYKISEDELGENR